MPAPPSPALRRARPSRTDRGLKGRLGAHLQKRVCFSHDLHRGLRVRELALGDEGRPPNRYDVLGVWRGLGRLCHERGAGVRALPARGAAQADGGHVARLSTSPNPDARAPAPRCRPRWCRCPTAGCPKGWPARRRRCRRRAGTPRPSLPPAAAAPLAVPHSARRTKPQPARLRSGAQGSCPTPAHHDGRAGHCGQGQPAGNAERPRAAGVAVIGC